MKQCTGEDAREHRDFDPRFFSLGADAAYAETVILVAMQHVLDLLRYRPRNAALTRVLLTVEHGFPYPSDKATLDLLEANAALPAAEWARWQQRARDYRELNDYVASGHRLADESMGTGEGAADLRGGRMMLFFTVVRQTAHTWKDWLAAQQDPSGHAIMPARGHPRFVELTLTFARLAAESRQPGFAPRALEYLETARIIDPALEVPDALELELGLLSRDFTHGLPPFVRELPQHLDDPAWLLRYLPIAEQAPPEVFRRYVDALALASPQLPLVRLLIARARSAEEDGLARYEEIFAGRPGLVQPNETDWSNYLELLEDAAERSSFLDGGSGTSSAAATFDATVERWHQAVGVLPEVAEQYAYLLTRRARVADNTAAYEAAWVASQRALHAGSQSVRLMRGLTELQKRYDFQHRRDTQSAEQDRAIEASLAKDRAEGLKKFERRQTARLEYIAGINERLRDLELDLNYGKVDDEQRENLRAALRHYHAVVKNYCKSCNAVGLQRNGEDCAACDGTGMWITNGAGVSAKGY